MTWTNYLGRVWQDGEWWLAELTSTETITQGKTRDEAKAMLADAIESLVNEDGFKVEVSDVAAGSEGVIVRANDPGRLERFVTERKRP